jgi:uncharacterized membrane protein HdeD (DUF308 family)
MATYPVDELADQAKETARDVSGFWWLWLITGTIWILAALVVLQFDKASVTTVGIITGLLFLFASVQEFTRFSLIEGGWRWVSLFFGVLLAAAGILALINP